MCSVQCAVSVMVVIWVHEVSRMYVGTVDLYIHVHVPVTLFFKPLTSAKFVWLSEPFLFI